MMLDAELFYQESWDDPNYTMSDWDDESVWAWGTKGIVNFGIESLTSLNSLLTQDTPVNSTCSGASINCVDGVAKREADDDACSDTSSLQSLERVATGEITNGGLFIMVGSSLEELCSAENGGSMSFD
ncbi:hypothetical protein CGRA01v4_07332 [Colletotrichum graminicola]|uniref:Uncharacterized protein n=1 Tax=Colletotrichum graminicola (strain M1.001 / M2 / FGSC 10212) TaxID=645133 RepID=E3QC98_COLGM|nr:uncharacterized protein GLRG_03630 [Colletotrichum graminicola M1.001]EFQ28486.1 hypothetical protein GLRG_03630 [Colletotrichum graminicola M1.001]WDK16051.1 hypothetical protein CGRA01v4_07332 [Colletotrichum graminicola]